MFVEATVSVYCDCDEDLCNSGVNIYDRVDFVSIFCAVFIISRLLE